MQTGKQEAFLSNVEFSFKWICLYLACAKEPSFLNFTKESFVVIAVAEFQNPHSNSFLLSCFLSLYYLMKKYKVPGTLMGQ